MFKFRCFKVSFDFITGKQRGFDCDLSPVSVNGAYRCNTYNDSGLKYNPPKESMVQLPNSQAKQLKSFKSTGDLTNETNHNPYVTRSTNDLSTNAHTVSKLQHKDNKKIEKQWMLERKRQEKIALQEKLAAQERNNKEQLEIKERNKREKLAARELQRQTNIAREKQSKKEKSEAVNKLRSKKKAAPTPPQPNVNLQIPNRSQPNPAKQTNKVIEPKPRKTTSANATNYQAYSTNTLESSISKSSGPPPYGEYPEIIIDVPNTNITFGKPVTDSSWDLISQHREQMSRTTAQIVPKRRKDFQYKVGNLHIAGNSDA